ncbi:hypothetical protein [Bosea sp. PAMC 26642]|uniref:hypothetical protein n=1 Tax=Bosea sp. (strain PAMC 26642) TaxID=1792307 RepID=UPI0012E74850|nr:hypothetical protein [Bosea sp. PAMC 26642]
MAEYLAFDTRMSPDEAKAILEVSIVSKETGKMERGRPDAEAYAKRRAADSVIGTREAAERSVAAILQESGSDRRTASAAAIAQGWKKATACINVGNGFVEDKEPAAGPTSPTTAAKGWKAATARANASLD